MKAVLLLAASLGVALNLNAQVTLRAGEVVNFPYRMIPPASGPSCVSVFPGTPSSAGVHLLLDQASMQGNGSFQIEILLNPGGASSTWTGSNSPLSLSTVGYFFAGFGSVRLTGLTGEVVITRISMPWVTSEYDSVTRTYRSCSMDGIPFVPNLRLAAGRPDAGQLRLRWTTNAPEFRLVATDFLPATAWSEVTNAPNIVDSYFQVTLDTPSSRRFFQLQKSP